jgi:unsaturated rhamnogalacturonyl hydrolase
MKKYLCLLLILSLIFSCASEKTKDNVVWSQKMVESHGLGDFYCNKHYQGKLDTTGWDYVSGLVALSVLKTWEQYPEKTEYYAAVKQFADNCLNEDGTLIVTKSGKSALRPSNIDDLPAGRVFFTLYKEELRKGNNKDAERYRNALSLVRNTLKFQQRRIGNDLPGAGGFYHKAIYPNQMWLDGLYMGSPVYAQWENTFGKDNKAEFQSSWDDIALQFKILHEKTYNKDFQLNYHAWSALPTDSNSFWAKAQEPYLGCSKEFWARGMGWYFAALVDVLEFMPTDHIDYQYMLTITNQVASGLKRWQDEKSGLWYQLLQYDSTMTADGIGDQIAGKKYNVGTAINYVESSASSIFTYAYFKGIRLGLLDKQEFLPVANKAYQGLLDNFIEEKNNKIDIIQSCASAGLGPAKDPSRTGTINYYLAGKDVGLAQNEGKAIGSFILASLEFEKQ